MKNFELLMIIPNVFSENHHISSNTYNGQLFGGAYTFFCHPHPLTFIEEIKNYPRCNSSCEELIYHCAQCNFNMHRYCL